LEKKTDIMRFPKKIINLNCFSRLQIIFVVFIFNIFLVITPKFKLINSCFASPKNNFMITRNTLDHLQREGFTKALTEMFVPIINKVYLSRKDFIDALPILLVEKHQEILLRYASTEKIKIQADEFSSDLNENAAVFRGNVKGFVPRENIELTTAKLRLVSGEDSDSEKLIGEGGVQVKQWDRETRSDFAIYTQKGLDNRDHVNNLSSEKNNIKPEQTLQLKGNVLIKAKQGAIRSDSFILDIINQNATLEGTDTSREGRIKVEANLSDLETKNNSKAYSSNELLNTKKDTSESQKVLLFASRAVLNNFKHQAMFEGDVEMERTPDNLFIHAGKITLNLGELQELISIHAEREVCFEQPGRIAKSDKASFNEVTQTILLEGNAEVQSGKFHLQGDIINLYLDVNKGVAQGANKAPIQMTVLGENSPSIFRCR
tara:strand:+ start:485 stop:1780 length:1296 start_codon:yes stop_codon:yes gene_type:complete